MKRAEVGQVLRYDGELVEVIGIADGRTVIMAPVGAPTCPACQHTRQLQVLEDSSLFQEHARPVETLT